ncbi:hypothetical protein Syun_014158 [Stephania yunnanensis]|uniref:Uncharacterized protein n=1 Tax=Stephania yunnanensis TaxID=152371 RepID=A0AAP0P8B9_9MAGN
MSFSFLLICFANRRLPSLGSMFSQLFLMSTFHTAYSKQYNNVAEHIIDDISNKFIKRFITIHLKK